jgi:hypothetical protein
VDLIIGQPIDGVYTFPSGDVYVGTLRGGDFNGTGTYTFLNGNKYTGRVKFLTSAIACC